MVTHPLQLKSVGAEVPIIGFTGALGSGCTYFAEVLASEYRYEHYKLSSLIRKAAKEKRLEPTTRNLQDVGNLLRKDRGLDYLVRGTLRRVDRRWSKARNSDRPVGIIIDGIRNTAEVEALRQFPNFYLFSVHAERDKRQERLLHIKAFPSEGDFEKADTRDAEEMMHNGQQVRRCNYLADVILVNDEDVPENTHEARKNYVRGKLDKYIGLIGQLSRGEPLEEHRPSIDEVLMTMAYCESRSSSCLKRGVGCVIARKSGEILAAACNEVPLDEKPCIELDDGRCVRDTIKEEFAERIRHCPACGKEIDQSGLRCLVCRKKIHRFLKKCPHCSSDPEVEYVCQCGANVYRDFLPGESTASGRLLDMCRALHAEENAILNLSRTGMPVPPDAVLYTTTFPCNLCANKIAVFGIKKVVYAEPYDMKAAKALLESQHVETKRFQGVKSLAYFRLYR